MERLICQECLQKMKQRPQPACSVCGRFITEPGDDHLCSECIKHRPPFSRHCSCAEYRGLIKDMLLLYKYKKIKRFGRHLSRYVLDSLGEDPVLWWGIDEVVEVPLHPKKKRSRGFNQSEEIARMISREKKIPHLKNCLQKKAITVPQTSLESKERKSNVKGAFKVKDPNRVQGKIFLLVDDVYTTGATLKECSSVLLEAGAREVRAVTVAQA